MWNKLYDIANVVFNLGKDLQQNRFDIKQVQSEVRELGAKLEDELHKVREALQHMAYEVQRTQENAAHEREKMELRLEIHDLRAQLKLPSGEPTRDEAEE